MDTSKLTKDQKDALSQRITMKVVKFVTTRAKSGRRGSPAIPSGTTLYAIAYNHIRGGFYTYSYIDRQDATNAIEMMKKHQTDNEFYYPWNVVYNVEDTLHVSPRTSISLKYANDGTPIIVE